MEITDVSLGRGGYRRNNVQGQVAARRGHRGSRGEGCRLSSGQTSRLCYVILYAKKQREVDPEVGNFPTSAKIIVNAAKEAK